MNIRHPIEKGQSQMSRICNLAGRICRTAPILGRRSSAALPRRRSQAAFTMIEIAIAVGVIGFAMVAIIGILPAGMNSQKDNKEDTIIAQDAPYFLNAIRNGEQRTNIGVLTSFVEQIIVTNIDGGVTNAYTNYNPALSSGIDNDLTNDLMIVGLLSTPECDLRIPNQTNIVTAIVRAMSGSATEQGGANSLTAFRYMLTVENLPWNYYGTGQYYENINTPNPVYGGNRMNYLQANLRELRLKFAWPVHLLPSGAIQSIGQGRQTYRTLIASHLSESNSFSPTLWFYAPQSYTNATNIANQ